MLADMAGNDKDRTDGVCFDHQPRIAPPMPIDYMHAALGFMFFAIWAMISQVSRFET